MTPKPFILRLLMRPLADAALFWLLVIVLAAVFASHLTEYDPTDQDLLAIKQLPSAEHWLGTDALGRDVWSRLLFGSLPTIAGIGEAMVTAFVLGLGLGLTAGYFGGRLDRLVMQLVDLTLSLPGIVILLAVLAVFRHDMLAAMVVMGMFCSSALST